MMQYGSMLPKISSKITDCFFIVGQIGHYQLDFNALILYFEWVYQHLLLRFNARAVESRRVKARIVERGIKFFRATLVDRVLALLFFNPFGANCRHIKFFFRRIFNFSIGRKYLIRTWPKILWLIDRVINTLLVLTPTLRLWFWEQCALQDCRFESGKEGRHGDCIFHQICLVYLLEQHLTCTGWL